MIGRPARVHPEVRVVPQVFLRATRSYALPLAVTIVVMTVVMAAWLARTTGSGAPLMSRRGSRPWCRPKIEMRMTVPRRLSSMRHRLAPPV